jgi:hypothetical protein
MTRAYRGEAEILASRVLPMRLGRSGPEIECFGRRGPAGASLSRRLVTSTIEKRHAEGRLHVTLSVPEAIGGLFASIRSGFGRRFRISNLAATPSSSGPTSVNRPIIALVDIASVCPSGNEQDHVDALELVGNMLRTMHGTTDASRSVVEVACRIYGGFRDIAGNPTERRTWLARNLNRLRGLADGVRLIPEIAESLAAAPEAMLVGTYANQRQTMVDGMIAEDAGLFARSADYQAVVLISNDDDFVPVAITIARATSTNLQWLRRRARGRNDELMGSSVDFVTDWRWQ